MCGLGLDNGWRDHVCGDVTLYPTIAVFVVSDEYFNGLRPSEAGGRSPNIPWINRDFGGFNTNIPAV